MLRLSRMESSRYLGCQFCNRLFWRFFYLRLLEMPRNSKVGRCVARVKKGGKAKGAAIAICQASTGQAYATGKKPKGKTKR